MNIHNSLSALLPPTRDDEPADLRQDILDELGDHLACAYNRELMRGVDSSSARQRVLDRFGDPAAMARRLWLDAMKGKIMAKRVLIATCVVVMVACATSVALAWQWMNQDRLLRNRAVAEAIEANRRMSEALARSQETNQEMLKQMREMSLAVTHPVSPDWNPVTFKLTLETADGPPAAGFSLTLTRSAGNTTRTGRREVRTLRDDLLALSPTNSARRQLHLVLPAGLIAQGSTGQFGGMGGGGMGGGGMGGGGMGMAAAMAQGIHRTSDSSGVADFGAVQPGDYKFQITKNWATGQFTTAGELNVAPGSKVQRLIACPKTPPERPQVRIRCSWPADLEKEQLVLYAPFVFRYRKLDPGLEWVLSDSSSSRWQRRGSNRVLRIDQSPVLAIRSVLCGPGNTLAEVIHRKAPFFWTFSQVNLDGQAIAGATPGVWADFLTEDLREVTVPMETPEPHELTWEPGTFGLDRLIVLRPTRSPKIEKERRRFDIVVGSFAYYPRPSIQIRGEPPNTNVITSEGVQDRGGPPTKKDLETSAEVSSGSGFGGMGGNNTGWIAWLDPVPTVALPPEFWDKMDIGFEARPGQVNEWTIHAPDELNKAVRAALSTK